PDVIEWGVPYTASAAFPSGHALLSMVLYVALAYIVHRLAPSRWMGLLAIAVTAILVLLVGASRVYLGVHYPSDVLAGYLVGFAWAIFCSTAVEILWGVRRAGKREEATS